MPRIGMVLTSECLIHPIDRIVENGIHPMSLTLVKMISDWCLEEGIALVDSGIFRISKRGQNFTGHPGHKGAKPCLLIFSMVKKNLLPEGAMA